MQKPQLQVCKQQQTASGIKTCLCLGLAFLTIHNTTLMSTPHLQVCKQQQTASGVKMFKLMFMPCVSVPDYETWYTGTQYHSHVKTTFNNEQPPALKTCLSACVSFSSSNTWCTGTPHCSNRYQRRIIIMRPPRCLFMLHNPLCIGGT